MRETRSGMVRAVAVVAAMMVGCMPAGSDGGAIAMWGRRKGVTEVSGDVLHLHTGQTNSFCAEISDGSLIAWSHLSGFFGGAKTVAEGLDSNVVSFRDAFLYNAVLLKNGSVTAWDRNEITPVRVENMKANVSSLHSTVISHAALKSDGSVSYLTPDNLDTVEPPEIANAQKIVQNVAAYTALLDNGEVITWSTLSARFSHIGVDFPGPVKDIFASKAAFAAVTENNEVVAWANQSLDARVTLTGEISQLLDTECGFLAVNSDGVGVVWPPLSNGTPISTVDFRVGVESVHVFAESCESYAAILKDKSVVTWGLYGGDSSKADLSGGVESIAASRRAFAALKTDGSVVSWGDPSFGGDDSEVDFSGGVTTIKGINAAFAALKRDGTVVAWGNETQGADVSAIDQSGGVSELVSDSNTFVVALLRSASPTVSPTLPTPYPTVPLPETGGFLSPEVSKALFIASMSLGAIVVLSKLCSSCGKRTTSTETDEIVAVDSVFKP